MLTLLTLANVGIVNISNIKLTLGINATNVTPTLLKLDAILNPGPTVPGPMVPGPMVPGPMVPGPMVPLGFPFLNAGCPLLECRMFLLACRVSLFECRTPPFGPS